MYSNYQSLNSSMMPSSMNSPMMSSSSMMPREYSMSSSSSMTSPMMSYSSMMPREYSMSSSSMGQDSRLIGGGFFGPFLLGGITGGLLAPAFYPRPYYYSRPYPYYGPYYR